MQELLQDITDIELKIKSLSEKFSALKEDNINLVQENYTLKKDLDQIRKDFHELEVKSREMVKIMNMSSSAMDQKETIKKELDYYVQEIDKCINMVQEIG